MAFLRADGPLTALQPYTRIYGQEQPPNPEYPFTRFGAPGAIPLEYSCVNGSTITADIHVFSENEDECNVIAAEIVTALDNASLDLGGDGTARARWTGGLTMRDAEDEDLWHAVRTFDFEAME